MDRTFDEPRFVCTGKLIFHPDFLFLIHYESLHLTFLKEKEMLVTLNKNPIFSNKYLNSLNLLKHISLFHASLRILVHNAFVL